MKKYPEIKFKNISKGIDFPDYDNFDNINTAYSNFINKVEIVIDKIAPFKKICIRNKTSEWVDLEIINGIKIVISCLRNSRKQSHIMTPRIIKSTKQ